MSLAPVLFDRLAAAARVVTARLDASELEDTLSRLVATGRDAWPELQVDPRAWVAYLADRLPANKSLQEGLAAMHGAELYLAYACHTGDPRAIAALERAYASHLDAVIRGLSGQGLSSDDFRQIVRRKLFVAAADAPAKITSYAGTGSLAAWLRVTARRAGLNAVRGKELAVQSTPDDDLFEFPQTIGDPELDYLKETYREEFREAFLEAAANLPSRERTLLRQTIGRRLTVRQIGRMYQVHHATAARWIADARQTLIDATRNALQARLAVSQRELQSIMGLIASRLDVSVMRVLGSDDEPADG
ncbi:MAG: sigma-70 family RNA polymerase sigma factor [Myxococcota bacterium]